MYFPLTPGKVSRAGAFSELSVSVDQDGDGEVYSFQEVAVLGLAQPVSEGVLSVIFDNVDGAVGIDV